MQRFLLPTSLALACLVSLPATADDTLRNVLSSGATTGTLYSTFKDHKLLVPAREDASAFIASGGTIRGAYLEAALREMRDAHTDVQASDAQLAQAILLTEPGVAAP